MKLIATKSYHYNTRRLKAGDEFDATDIYARLLVGMGKAQYAPEAAAPKPTARAIDDDGANIERLRAQAERLGLAVDGRWGVMRLQQEIAMAKL